MYTDISHLGKGFLAAVFLLSGFAVILGLLALSLKEKMAKRVLFWTRRVVFTTVALSVVVLVLFVIGFLKDDFSIDLVRQYSSVDMLARYKLSAVWASSAGSLLLWSVFTYVLFGLWLMIGCKWQVAESEQIESIERSAKGDPKFNAAALSIGAALCLGFSALCLFAAKPFAVSPEAVENGVGLSPLLQNFWMIVHPPLLFIGYAALLVPFVIISAAVFSGTATDPYVYKQLRQWLLFGVCFLALGIATGARWSYLELGWGGYWAWDPVENTSLLPLLIALAALHSVVGVRDSGRFKRWIVFLIPVPFILCLVATFITRSGILISLHVFGQDVMFISILVFIVCCFLLWIACIITAVRSIPVSARRLSPLYLNKGDLLFWLNVILVLTVFVIGLATLSPIIYRLIVSSELDFTITRPFYDRIISIVGILLAFIIGLGALVGFQKRKGFILRVLSCSVVGLMCFEFVFNLGGVPLLLSMACGVCAFSSVVVLMKLFSTVKENGGVGAGIGHLGFLLLVVAAGFSSMEQEVQMRLSQGEKFIFGKYEFVYDSFERDSSTGLTKEGPEIIVRKGNMRTKLWPHHKIYSPQQIISEIDVHTTLFEDIYFSFSDVSPRGRVGVSATIKPFMLWLWIAVVLIAIGLTIAILESRTIDKQPKAEEDKSGADESSFV